jgi:DNA-binding transcriptional ArsR family regulator
MEIKDAIAGFGALAQESRLEVFRLLVRAGADGLPAGEIARTLGVPHNTMSSHLGILAQAGLVTARREGRSIIYAIDFTGVRALLSFLMEDCCQGAPEICAPAIAGILDETGCASVSRAKPARRASS